MNAYFIRLAVDLDPEGKPVGYHISTVSHLDSRDVCHWQGSPDPADHPYYLVARLLKLVDELGLVQEPFPL